MASLALLLAGVLITAPAGGALDAAIGALDDYRVKEAIALFEKAKLEGPYDHASYVRLFEQLGIAYAYDGRTDDALKAFEVLLELDPAHALRYSLSPKVTLVFEQARSRAPADKAPRIDLSWPRDRTPADPLPIDVEVISDPGAFLKTGEIGYRLQGETAFRRIALDLPPVGRSSSVMIPPIDPEAERAETLELAFSAFDAKGNEVFVFAPKNAPREVPLRHEPPPAWYQRWWIWAIAIGVVAAGSTTGVYLATHEKSSNFNLHGEINR
jgi:tetratricopeptide (TPR) repeat protein